MKRVFGLLVLFGVLAGGGLVASAQEPPEMPPPGAGPGPGGPGRMQMQLPNFADLDKNKDKKIGKDEFPMPPQFFDRLDENRDGVIDEEEFNRARTRMAGGGGGGPRLSDSLGKLMDANQDTKVSREEFARINQVFDVLDKDHNGELTTDELNRFFEGVREVQNQATGGVSVQGLFDKKDTNKDGTITAEEMASDREFKQLDLNKDGSLTRQEAEEGLKRLELARQKKAASSPAPNK